jgi:hypothetical protein
VGTPSAAPSTVEQPGTPLGLPSAGNGELRKQTAWGVVRALTRAGFGAANPLDTTAYECPSAGCQESVVTDQLRVKSFASPQLASRYATARGLNCVGTIVVSFAPPLAENERQKYWAEVVRLAGGSK